jgi:CBS domain-containing protein
MDDANQMLVKDVMTKKVITAKPDDSILEIADVMSKNRFHGIPVVSGDKVVGIVTETDFFTKDASRLFLPSFIFFLGKNRIREKLPAVKQAEMEKLMKTQVKDVMSTPCRTVSEEMPVSELLEFFRKTGLTTIPVVNRAENLAGIITLNDILILLKV